MKKQTRTKKRQSEVASSEVSSWVIKSRKLEKETVLLQRSKIFEDEDTTNQTDHHHHLAGVKVLHGLGKVAEEGGTLVLTIKDQPILADHGDVVIEELDMLENVQIRQQKMRDEAYKAAKKKTTCIYDDDDDKFNDDPKYDEEGITLDERGGFSGEELQRRRLTCGVSTNNFEDLTSSGKVVSSDYYSHEEMLQFKKLKKKKKDKLDINALEAEAISSGLGLGDLGSRKDIKRQAIKVQQERLEEAEMRNNAYQSAYAKAADEASKLLADEVKKQEGGGVFGPQAIALLATSNHNNNETVVDDQNPKVVFTEMGEFVWGLHIDEEARNLEHKDVLTIEEEQPNSEEDKEIVPDETIHEVAVGKGLSGALKLLKDRGTLKESIDEWSGGRNMDKKEIHIERTDEFGRILTPKEAFCLYSQKFHGKGPGKTKQEKRIKQYYQELKMKSSDTLLLSVERMRETQSRLKTPYLVLS